MDYDNLVVLSEYLSGLWSGVLVESFRVIRLRDERY